ncbi:MAG: T9SS type A sorting domain-containing protein [Prevotellaceae bacterium]|nr:T9SS type A sorting domain-containing protein [Prevotellaceae bacterium]
MKRMLPHRQRRALLPACLSLLLGLSAHAAQRVQYSYDAAGNRVLRKTVAQAFPEVETETETETETKVHNMAAQNTAATQPAQLDAAIQEQKITVYPNPTHGLLVVDIADSEQLTEVQVLLYSLSGALVRQWRAASGSNTLDIGEQPPGIYIVCVVQGKGQATSWRIVKE